MKKPITNKSIGKKISTIMKEGVRENTHKPYNKKTNPRRKVSRKQAIAIALSMQDKQKKKKA